MDPNNRAALVVSAVVLAIAIVVASTVALERIDTRNAGNDAPPGTVGLARPHPPLDRAPGVPIPTVGSPPNGNIRQRS